MGSWGVVVIGVVPNGHVGGLYHVFQKAGCLIRVGKDHVGVWNVVCYVKYLVSVVSPPKPDCFCRSHGLLLAQLSHGAVHLFLKKFGKAVAFLSLSYQKYRENSMRIHRNLRRAL